MSVATAYQTFLLGALAAVAQRDALLKIEKVDLHDDGQVGLLHIRTPSGRRLALSLVVEEIQDAIEDNSEES
jgi:hypothetical protein